MIWLKYGPLKQLTEHWASVRPDQQITIMFDSDIRKDAISYFDVNIKTAPDVVYPVTLEGSYDVLEYEDTTFAFSVKISDLVKALIETEPERGGYVKLTLGTKDYLASKRTKNPCDSLHIGYQSMKRSEPAHEYLHYDAYAPDSDVFINRKTNRLFFNEGTHGVHFPTKFELGNSSELHSVRSVLNKTYKPATANYMEEDLTLMAQRRRANPAADTTEKKEEPEAKKEVDGPIGDLPPAFDPTGLTADDMLGTADDPLAGMDPETTVVLPPETYQTPSEALAAAGQPEETGSLMPDNWAENSEATDEEAAQAEADAETLSEDKALAGERTSVSDALTDFNTDPVVPAVPITAADIETTVTHIEDPVIVIDADVAPADIPTLFQQAKEQAALDHPKFKSRTKTRTGVIEELQLRGWIVLSPDEQKEFNLDPLSCMPCPDDSVYAGPLDLKEEPAKAEEVSEPVKCMATVDPIGFIKTMITGLTDAAISLEEKLAKEEGQEDPLAAAIKVLTELQGKQSD